MKILVTYPTRAELNRIVERTIQREEAQVSPAGERNFLLRQNVLTAQQGKLRRDGEKALHYRISDIAAM